MSFLYLKVSCVFLQFRYVFHHILKTYHSFSRPSTKFLSRLFHSSFHVNIKNNPKTQTHKSIKGQPTPLHSSTDISQVAKPTHKIKQATISQKQNHRILFKSSVYYTLIHTSVCTYMQKLN